MSNEDIEIISFTREDLKYLMERKKIRSKLELSKILNVPYFQLQDALYKQSGLFIEPELNKKICEKFQDYIFDIKRANCRFGIMDRMENKLSILQLLNVVEEILNEIDDLDVLRKISDKIYEIK